MYASSRVSETRVRNECEGSLSRADGRSPVFMPSFEWDGRGAARGHRDCFIAGLVHLERTRWDPKDGELCLARAKPGETLVEARLDSDVQIDPQSWV